MLPGIPKVNMEPRDLLIAIRESGLTQAQVSERTGIPQPTISKLERGDVQDVMSRNYRALQALYDEISKEKSAA
jgi:predicted transcriptional regulator